LTAEVALGDALADLLGVVGDAAAGAVDDQVAGTLRARILGRGGADAEEGRAAERNRKVS